MVLKMPFDIVNQKNLEMYNNGREYADLAAFNISGIKGAKLELELHEILLPILGILIIFINLIVLVSSGLLLRKGQQPRTTYLFLGNIALADMVIGMSTVFGQWFPREYRNDILCAIEIGMLVAANLSSVYSIGLIAVDRFLYILAGLRYQKYIYPSRARMLIFVAWTVSILVGFIPAMGYRGDTCNGKKCWFILIEPAPLILATTTVGSIPLILTIILYSIILYYALKKTQELKNAAKNRRGTNSGSLRIFRGGSHTVSSIGNENHEDIEMNEDTRETRVQNCCLSCKRKSKSNKTPSAYTPSKWKAIKVVLFTTGAFSITWLPYFVASILYAFCDKKQNMKFKEQLQIAIASPLAILGITNSFLNPAVYAWWHPGFRKSFQNLWRKRCINDYHASIRKRSERSHINSSDVFQNNNLNNEELAIAPLTRADDDHTHNIQQ